MTGESREVNTNKIEGAWNWAKKRLRAKQGVMRTTFESHILAISWQLFYGDNALSNFTQHLRSIFSLVEPPKYEHQIPMFQDFIPEPYLKKETKFQRAKSFTMVNLTPQRNLLICMMIFQLEISLGLLLGLLLDESKCDRSNTAAAAKDQAGNWTVCFKIRIAILFGKSCSFR